MRWRDILWPWGALREARAEIAFLRAQDKTDALRWMEYDRDCWADRYRLREKSLIADIDALRAELASELAEHEATRDFLATTERQCDAWKARAETAEHQAVELAGRLADLSRLTTHKRDAKGRFVG